MRRLLQGLALLVSSGSAFSHELVAQYGPFFGPALHIFSEIDHLAAFAALGLLAGQNVKSVRVVGIAVFGLAFITGMTLAQVLPGLSVIASHEALFSALSVLTAGLLVVLAKPLPHWLLGLFAGALGFLHGAANGLAIPANSEWLLSVLGGGMAAMGIVVTAAWIAALPTQSTGRLVVRVLGSWVAALGLMLSGLALRS